VSDDLLQKTLFHRPELVRLCNSGLRNFVVSHEEKYTYFITVSYNGFELFKLNVSTLWTFSVCAGVVCVFVFDTRLFQE
jgi:hypothetical protein